MKTIKTNLTAPPPIKIQEGSYARIKRTYPKPNTVIGYWESLSYSK